MARLKRVIHACDLADLLGPEAGNLGGKPPLVVSRAHVVEKMK